MSSASRATCALVLAALVGPGCKGKDAPARRAADPAATPPGAGPNGAGPNGAVPGGAVPGGAGPVATTPSAPAPTPTPVAGCEPVAPHQRAGKATLTLVGDGLEVRAATAVAVCGAFHTEATRRFAVGDGTLFKACLPDGFTVSIAADVVLTGKQSLVFTYEDYKKKTALIELARPGVGTYAQKDEPGETDNLTIAYDWAGAEAHVDLVWPSKKDRVVRVDAVFDCGGPLR